MTGQRRNSNSKANGNWWRFENSHCGRWAVSSTPSDTFFSSLLRRRISESVNPSDSYPETPTSSTPPTTTSSSSSSTSASVPASVLHTPLTSVCPSGPPTGLSPPLSPATFSSGTAKGEGEAAVWTADLLSARDELSIISDVQQFLFVCIFRLRRLLCGAFIDRE